MTIKFRCKNGHISIENIICDYCKELGTPIDETPVKQAAKEPEAKKKAE